MCGILGIISKKELTNKDEFLISSLNLLHHRGPDNTQAVYFSKKPSLETKEIRSLKFDSEYKVFLGHTRLSIIDLSDAGTQPMCNEDGTVWIIFNGEIYNFQSLRSQLKTKHTFNSNSDTEVILHAYEEWGSSFIDKLNGMFTFVLFDIKNKKIIAARDQIGIKPLYLYHDSDKIIFSSEIKPILSLAEKPFKLNEQSIRDYLCLGYIPTPNTPFIGIEKLPPSNSVTIDLLKSKLDIECNNYWQISKEIKKDERSESELVDNLDNYLSSSIKGCLVSDVPVGIFLSGGMDSSIITYLASRIKGSPLRTFSIGFKERDYDESKFAKEVSKICGTEHSHFYVDQDFLKYIPALVDSTEEPVADPASIPLWFLSKEASKEVKVVLSGEGGDEIFGGYTRYFWDKMGRLYENLPEVVRKTLSAVIQMVPDSGEMTTTNLTRRIKKFFRTGSLDQLNRYLSWFALFSPDEADALLASSLTDKIDKSNLEKTFATYFNAYGDDSYLKRIQYIDMRTMLLDNLLLKADKLSMAHSLEVRVPLLDINLVDFAINMEPSMKVRNGQTKYILRKFLKGKLPDQIFDRRKQGFEMPIGKWLRERDWESSKKKILKLSDYFSILKRDKLEEILNEHEKGKVDIGRKIYSLLVLSIWFEKYANFLKIE